MASLVVVDDRRPEAAVRDDPPVQTLGERVRVRLGVADDREVHVEARTVEQEVAHGAADEVRRPGQRREHRLELLEPVEPH